MTWSDKTGLIAKFKILRSNGFIYLVCWNLPMFEATCTRVREDGCFRERYRNALGKLWAIQVFELAIMEGNLQQASLFNNAKLCSHSYSHC